MHLYLLNARGGPWFTFSPESIEDYIKIPLHVVRVDHLHRIIHFTAAPFTRRHVHLGIVEEPKLFRRSTLDRLQWCLKMQLQSKESTQILSKKNLFTVIAPDTPIETHGAHGSITTFDMQFVYQTNETPVTDHLSALKFSLLSFQCSYSYFFSKIDQERSVHYGNWSVHEGDKLQLLKRASKDMGLEWKDKYWTFDLVLHWLTFGEESMVQAVVEFLVEHEVQYSQRSQSPKRRYYRSESVDLF
jgi:hypothetical protein